MNSTPDGVLIDRLRQRTITIVKDVIPRDRPIALLDFPRYSNVGDAAIWLGEVACLVQSGVRAHDIRYMCGIRTYDERALRDAIGTDGVILLSGGGNFGDLWPVHQRFRESVIAAFPDNQIVILPQSIQFCESAALDQAVRSFNAHRDLTILVRDQPSFELLAQRFTARRYMCPDAAFCLGPIQRPFDAAQDIVYLARADKESRFSGDANVEQGVPPCDWPEIGAAWQWRAGKIIADLQVGHPRVARMLRAPVMAAARTCYNAMANERIDAGYRLLARGRVVVTDRLHAHILALLLGIPHVVLDNSYGKLRRFHEAWTSESTLTAFAETREEAFATAAVMLNDQRSVRQSAT